MKESASVVEDAIGSESSLPSCSNLEVHAATPEIANRVPKRVYSEPFGYAEMSSTDTIATVALFTVPSSSDTIIATKLAKSRRHAEPTIAAEAAL
jgi:hypothetical protein